MRLIVLAVPMDYACPKVAPRPKAVCTDHHTAHTITIFQGSNIELALSERWRSIWLAPSAAAESRVPEPLALASQSQMPLDRIWRPLP